jgi:GntR family transcriptional regulator
MIRFRLDGRSGLPAYRQLVEQVRQAIRLGQLQPGDQLPTVREVVRQVTINPNTVHRAYRELEQQGLVRGRQGQGTFVIGTLGDPSSSAQADLQEQMDQWVRMAREAGLDDEGMQALLASSLRDDQEGGKK